MPLLSGHTLGFFRSSFSANLEPTRTRGGAKHESNYEDVRGAGVSFGFCRGQTFPEKVALVGARVIDGTGWPPIENAVVLIAGDKI